MMKQKAEVISDTGVRRLVAYPSEDAGHVVLVRTWKATRPGFVDETDGMDVSLTELEEVLKRHNGGEKREE